MNGYIVTFFDDLVDIILVFYRIGRPYKISMGTPQRGVINTRGWEIFANNAFISETERDRRIVTMEHNRN